MAFTYHCPGRSARSGDATWALAASQASKASSGLKFLAHMALTVGRPRRAEKRSAFRHRTVAGYVVGDVGRCERRARRWRKALRFSALRGRPTVNAIRAKFLLACLPADAANPPRADRSVDNRGQGVGESRRGMPPGECAPGNAPCERTPAKPPGKDPLAILPRPRRPHSRNCRGQSAAWRTRGTAFRGLRAGTACATSAIGRHRQESTP